MNSQDSLIQLYIGFTLVDITKTNITNARDSLTNPKGRNQQRNWETLTQALSLRAQPIVLESPRKTITNLSSYEFGNAFSGTHTVWSFMFGTEHAGVYDNDRPFGVLHSDFSSVPIIAGLDETVSFPVPIFVTSGPNKNVYFTILKA